MTAERKAAPKGRLFKREGDDYSILPIFANPSAIVSTSTFFS